MAFSPDPVINPEALYSTIFLSQRDLSLAVPVNFVTVPGVSINAACFGHKIYEDTAFGKCFSNLLLSGCMYSCSVIGRDLNLSSVTLKGNLDKFLPIYFLYPYTGKKC